MRARSTFARGRVVLALTGALHEPRLAEALVIHEMLHTLGLGENPPTSTEITKRVEGRCQ